MKPVKFKEVNVIFGKDQEMYEDLPGLIADNGDQAITKWRLSFFERLIIVFTGHIWLSMFIFRGPLQPVSMTLRKPFITVCKEEESNESEKE